MHVAFLVWKMSGIRSGQCCLKEDGRHGLREKTAKRKVWVTVEDSGASREPRRRADVL